MTEDRVKEAFFKNLENKELVQALIDTRKALFEEILADIFDKENIVQEAQELILKINDASGRLGYFPTSGINMEFNRSQPDYIKHYKFILEVWEELLRYVHDNYNAIRPEEIKQGVVRENLLELAESVSQKSAQEIYMFSATGSIMVRGDEMEVIEVWFHRILEWVLMGARGYALLKKESMEVGHILRKYQLELRFKNTKIN